MHRYVFLADMQLGAYATFSGMSADDVDRYATDLDMRVEVVPRVEGFEWDARRYTEAVDIVNAIGPDLVLIGGDMVDDPNSEDQYEEFMRITCRLDADLMVRWVPGNHDIADDTVVPSAESISTYRAAFGDDYFAFDHGSVRFVAMNTSVIDHPELVPDELDAQLAFIESELSDAAERGVTPVLLGHHPLFLRHPDEDDDYWNLPLERRRRLLDLVHRYGVRVGLAGHWHRNSEATAGEFTMITTGAVGYPLGTDRSGFRVLEFDGSALTHHYRPLRP